MRITLKELKKIIKQAINESVYNNVPGFYLLIDQGNGEKIDDTKYDSEEAAQNEAQKLSREPFIDGIKILHITKIIPVK